jgi:hypothetical protein
LADPRPPASFRDRERSQAQEIDAANVAEGRHACLYGFVKDKIAEYALVFDGKDDRGTVEFVARS